MSADAKRCRRRRKRREFDALGKCFFRHSDEVAKHSFNLGEKIFIFSNDFHRRGGTKLSQSASHDPCGRNCRGHLTSFRMQDVFPGGKHVWGTGTKSPW